MATALQVGDIVQVRSYTTVPNQTAVNRWHYWVTAIGGSPGTDIDLLTSLNTLIAGDMKNQLPANATWKGFMASIINRTPPPVPVQLTTGAGVGTIGVDCVAKQVCPIVSWYTANAGRKYRGRTYWPFMPVNWVDNYGEVVAAGSVAYDLTAGVLQNFTAVSNGGRTATVAMVIYHRVTGTHDNVVTRLTRATPATQKRRGDYGRPNVSPI